MKNFFTKLFNKDDKEITPEETAVREKIEKEFYVKAVWTILFSALFLVIVFAIVFFVNIEGKETTKVPKLEGLTLSEAIIELQEKALYPKLSVKKSTPADKGLILSQDISAGSVVRAGRLVGLTVSSGGVIDKVGSYEGQTIDSARAELKRIFAGSNAEPILVIGEPVYIKSEEPKGTILKQEPAAETEITDVTELTFYVSTGKQQASYIVPTFKGLRFETALAKISRWPIRYKVTVRDKAEGEDDKAGYVVSQLPDPGVTKPWSTEVEMVIIKPDKISPTSSFGVFELVVPSYPISVPMTYERVTPEGARELIFNTRTFGGALTIPYLEKVGTELIISIRDEEVESFIVRPE